ncbi:MAG: site-2 protease family protein [Bacteroidetes bacterium]|nr:MAG: site-2 protease family protein [Bacteroidota bacterium]
MQSRYSLNLGNPFGIRVSVHWTFSLLIAWIVFVSLNRGLGIEQILMHIVFVLALFVCVVLHEFGHSLVAIRFGGKVESITLLPIGGMANLSKMPEKPREEFLVSAAGPAVNVVIAAILWLYLAFIHPVKVSDMEFETITISNFPLMLLAANLFIVAFNLIPAFPMDGGRLFRSALSMKMSRLKATTIAKDIGQIFAIIFIIAGLFINPFLIIIGFFILLGAKGEHQMIKYQDILDNYTVKDVLTEDYSNLDAEDTLGEAAQKLVQISDRGFIIKSEGEYAGILTKNDLIKGLSSHGKEGKVKEVMSRDIKSVNSDMPLFEAYVELRKSGYDLVPVIENEKFKGILDLENVNEFLLIQKAIG